MLLLRPFILLLCLLLLGSCSSTRLAYDNLSWLVSWKTNDYIPLNRVQKRWLSARLDEHLVWHCSKEIPGYRPLLANLQYTFAVHDLQAAPLLDLIPQLEPAADRVLREIAPTLAELFRQLDHAQIAALQTNLAEQQQEMHDKFVAPDPATQARQRSARLEKRLNRWLGRLSEEQRRRIETWSAELQGQNRIWLDNRQHWQQQLLASLQQRSQTDFTEQITRLLVEREQYWTNTFREHAELNSRKGADMLADIINMASAAQRSRMASQFAKLDQDLQQMQCKPPPASV